MSEFIDREFPMTDANFASISAEAYKISGIVLGEHKKNLIYSRLSRRIRQLGLVNFDQYLGYLDNHREQEISSFINALTTNLTSFFRENHHFEFLEETVIPQWINERRSKVRIWSAGCSTGEEPYSIAMTLAKHQQRLPRDVKVLATDLDSNVLDHCRQGIYAADRVDGLEKSILKEHFLASGNGVKVNPKLQSMITFNRLNLLGSWPMKGKFDLIFCRNVVIYFDKPTQKTLFNRYADILSPGGYLFIGHSESMHGLNDRFRSLGRTMYQKVG